MTLLRPFEAAAAIETAATVQRQGTIAAEGADEEQGGLDEDEDGGGSSLFSHTARDELGREIAVMQMHWCKKAP